MNFKTLVVVLWCLVLLPTNKVCCSKPPNAMEWSGYSLWEYYTVVYSLGPSDTKATEQKKTEKNVNLHDF